MTKKTKDYYKRHYIVIGPQTLMLIQLYRGGFHLEDIDFPGFQDWINKEVHNTEKQAKQFIKQMEDHWTPAFLESLHDEIEKELIKHWKEFAPKRLREEPYTSWIKKSKCAENKSGHNHRI
jgi:hypothetical protein